MRIDDICSKTFSLWSHRNTPRNQFRNQLRTYGSQKIFLANILSTYHISTRSDMDVSESTIFDNVLELKAAGTEKMQPEKEWYRCGNTLDVSESTIFENILELNKSSRAFEISSLQSLVLETRAHARGEQRGIGHRPARHE